MKGTWEGRIAGPEAMAAAAESQLGSRTEAVATAASVSEPEGTDGKAEGLQFEGTAMDSA